MDPPYNVHLTQNSVQCKPNTQIVHRSANRGSGVVFLIASGFLQQKTDVVTTKGDAVNSLYINILCPQVVSHPYGENKLFGSGLDMSRKLNMFSFSQPQR